VAASKLVAKFVSSGMLVGVDSGDLCTATIEEIGAALDSKALSNVRIVASSDAIANEAAFVGVPQAVSADHDQVRSVRA
jgi:ribose 5-phosphate isomerase